MKPFDINNYEVLYTQCEISILHQIPTTWGSGGGVSLDMPIYAMLFRGELVTHLYENKRLDCSRPNLTNLVAHAYKEMFYYHFQRGEVWKERALAKALSSVAISLSSDSLYDKCVATHWLIRHPQLPISRRQYDDLCKDNGWVDLSGSIRIYGDTPSNGKQPDTQAFMEINVGTDPVWTTRGLSQGRIMTRKMSLSSPYRYGTELPLWETFVIQHLERIKAFVNHAG